MMFLPHLLRFLAVLLFSTLGTSIAFTMSQTATDLVFTQTQSAHFPQAEHIGFTARALPTTVPNVAITGDVTVIHDGAFVTHGAETRWASLNFGADFYAPNTGLRPPVTNPTVQQLASARDLGVDPRWVRSDGRIDWPPNNGFDGPPTITELQPGARFDRYGGGFQGGAFRDGGGFVSP